MIAGAVGIYLGIYPRSAGRRIHGNGVRGVTAAFKYTYISIIMHLPSCNA